VRIHSGNGLHEEMDRRAIACFDQAMQDAGLETAGPLRQVLHDYFAWATTTTMSRYHDSADEVPEGMSIPRWSWDGLQRRTQHTLPQPPEINSPGKQSRRPAEHEETCRTISGIMPVIKDQITALRRHNA
jgi:hypothetical protein